METVQAEFTIINALGLHARAAAQLVTAANRYVCETLLECEGQTVNAKSIMGVLMLAVAQGMKIRVSCTGEDGQACLHEFSRLIHSKFGESQ